MDNSENKTVKKCSEEAGLSQVSWWGHTDTLNLKGQGGGTTSHSETHAVTRFFAQVWTNHPNLATKFFKVTPNTVCLEVLFKTGLTFFGGCTFSICRRQLLSVRQAGHNGIIHNPLKMRQRKKQQLPDLS